MVGDDLASHRSCERDDLFNAHDYLAADIQAGTAGGDDRNRGLLARHELSYLVGEYRIAGQIEAGLTHHLYEVTDTMRHESTDQSPSMGAPHSPDPAAEKGLWAVMVVWQGGNVQPAPGEVSAIMRCTDNRDLSFPQPAYCGSIQMIEVAFLAMRYQAVRDRFKQRLRSRR